MIMFDDRPQTTVLMSSTQLNTGIDFVAINSNLRPLGDYYPRVDNRSGTGLYTIQFAQGNLTLPVASTSTFRMEARDVVAVRDTLLTAGVQVKISVTPQGASQDPELFLVGSDPSAPLTFVRSKANAAARSATAGVGAVETLTYTPTVSGWYGVVVTNNGGVGNYALTRS